jgi:hypothetical protein
MQSDALCAVDKSAREHFTYRPDGAINTWRSHADEVLAGGEWFGDCDDLASTVLDMLGRDGVALSDRYRLLVSTTHASKPNHMVGCVRAADGAFYIVGDTFAPFYPASVIAHRCIFYNQLSEAFPNAVWREGNPWRAK